jgi:hypothetical protein
VASEAGTADKSETDGVTSEGVTSGIGGLLKKRLVRAMFTLPYPYNYRTDRFIA